MRMNRVEQASYVCVGLLTHTCPQDLPRAISENLSKIAK